MIPLQSYADPPSDSKFTGFNSFELRLDDVRCLLILSSFALSILPNFQYVIPSDDTTYHCKIYKAPNDFPLKRHAVAVRARVLRIF